MSLDFLDGIVNPFEEEAPFTFAEFAAARATAIGEILNSEDGIPEKVAQVRERIIEQHDLLVEEFDTEVEKLDPASAIYGLGMVHETLIQTGLAATPQGINLLLAIEITQGAFMLFDPQLRHTVLGE